MPSESLIGRAVEYLVAATCVMGSRGDVNALTAMADDEGVDVIFQRRGGSATLAVQVKSRTMDAAVLGRGRFQADVRTATFRPRRELYLLFVAADLDAATLERCWLIPSLDFDAHANRVAAGTLRRFVASMSPSSRDRWSPYGLDRGELAAKVAGVLASLEP